MREKMIRFSIFVLVFISFVPIIQEIEIQVEWIIVVHDARKFCQKHLPVKVQINKTKWKNKLKNKKYCRKIICGDICN